MNPKELEQYKKNLSKRKDMFCTHCNQIYKKTNAYNCCLCGKTLIEYTDNIPKCPTCQSVNIERISTASKAVGAFAFGILSTTARSQFKCNNCGYKW